jgi:HSP20 family protein
MEAETKTISQKTEPALLPPVDLVEDAGGITPTADLPGADREELAIGIDGRTLTI